MAAKTVEKSGRPSDECLNDRILQYSKAHSWNIKLKETSFASQGAINDSLTGQIKCTELYIWTQKRVFFVEHTCVLTVLTELNSELNGLSNETVVWLVT